MKSSINRRIGTIQILRALAASLVVFHHYAEDIQQYSYRPSWIVHSGLGLLGASGVDLFFVISGFIMVYTSSRKGGTDDAVDFLKKRVRRVYPLYWIWTTVLLVLWRTGIAFKTHTYSLLFIIKSYLLIPAYNDTGYHPILPQGWTLSFEMLFYLIFAGAISLRLSRLKIIAIISSFALLHVVSFYLPDGSGFQYLFSQWIILEFAFGMIAAEIVLRLPQNNKWCSNRVLPGALICLGAVSLVSTIFLQVPPQGRFWAYGIPSALIVMGAALWNEESSHPILIYLGDASYSIYLIHGIFSAGYGMALKHIAAFNRVPADISIVVASLITIAVTSLGYKFIEKPLLNLLTRNKNISERIPVAAR
ncbi:acyltransferase [Acidobacterium sp. S8]|uniref:acyltransferase family protein n=1 Tax=Acidobacterium sp. S8 TaxID=1641854 RepID=UPI00131D737B|nr:acyltransferase [Acidobacterium sp. S8]